MSARRVGIKTIPNTPPNTKFKISDQIVKEAKGCPSNHACLDGNCEPCKPKTLITDGLLLVDKTRKEMCNYYHPFGYGGFCSCPVRNAIYRNYSK